MSQSSGSHCPTCGQPKFPEPSPEHTMALTALATSLSGNTGWFDRLVAVLEPLEPLLIEVLRKLLAKV